MLSITCTNNGALDGTHCAKDKGSQAGTLYARTLLTSPSIEAILHGNILHFLRQEALSHFDKTVGTIPYFAVKIGRKISVAVKAPGQC